MTSKKNTPRSHGISKKINGNVQSKFLKELVEQGPSKTNEHRVLGWIDQVATALFQIDDETDEGIDDIDLNELARQDRWLSEMKTKSPLPLHAATIAAAQSPLSDEEDSMELKVAVVSNIADVPSLTQIDVMGEDSCCYSLEDDEVWELANYPQVLDRDNEETLTLVI